jgi:hypothetical protein
MKMSSALAGVHSFGRLFTRNSSKSPAKSEKTASTARHRKEARAADDHADYEVTPFGRRRRKAAGRATRGAIAAASVAAAIGGLLWVIFR